MIKAVFVDVDNTILSFDEYVKEAMEEGFVKFGLPPYKEEMFQTFLQINRGLWLDHEKGIISFEDILKVRWNLIFKELGFPGDGPAFEEYFRIKLWDSGIPESGAKEMLEYLSAKYPLYVASNGPYDQQRNRLKVSGFEKYFKDFFISEDIGAPKPRREFFEEAFRRLNEGRRREGLEEVNPEETAIIGDSLTSDMAGGRAFGLQTFYFDREKAGVPEEAVVDVIFNSLNKLQLHI